MHDDPTDRGYRGEATWPAQTTAGSTPPASQEDRYELIVERARGGLGRVIEARDRRLHRVVAVKELLHRDPSGEARFVREAFLTAQLAHPSIVPVYAGRTAPCRSSSEIRSPGGRSRSRSMMRPRAKRRVFG